MYKTGNVHPLFLVAKLESQLKGFRVTVHQWCLGFCLWGSVFVEPCPPSKAFLVSLPQRISSFAVVETTQGV